MLERKSRNSCSRSEKQVIAFLSTIKGLVVGRQWRRHSVMEEKWNLVPPSLHWASNKRVSRHRHGAPARNHVTTPSLSVAFRGPRRQGMLSGVQLISLSFTACNFSLHDNQQKHFGLPERREAVSTLSSHRSEYLIFFYSLDTLPTECRPGSLKITHLKY